MPKHDETLIVGYHPDRLFELVSDVRSYPQFVKWIRQLRVSNEHCERTTTQCDADVLVGYKGFIERFSTRVVADSELRTVHANLLRGPFRQLSNTWRLLEHDAGACRIEFGIEYDFRNPMLSMLAATNSAKAVNRIIQSFTDEAARRYGPPAPV